MMLGVNAISRSLETRQTTYKPSESTNPWAPLSEREESRLRPKPGFEGRRGRWLSFYHTLPCLLSHLQPTEKVSRSSAGKASAEFEVLCLGEGSSSLTRKLFGPGAGHQLVKRGLSLLLTLCCTFHPITFQSFNLNGSPRRVSRAEHPLRRSLVSSLSQAVGASFFPESKSPETR